MQLHHHHHHQDACSHPTVTANRTLKNLKSAANAMLIFLNHLINPIESADIYHMLSEGNVH